jgi:hypothetical protein
VYYGVDTNQQQRTHHVHFINHIRFLFVMSTLAATLLYVWLDCFFFDFCFLFVFSFASWDCTSGEGVGVKVDDGACSALRVVPS